MFCGELVMTEVLGWFYGFVAAAGVDVVVQEAWSGCQVAGSVSSYGREDGHVKDIVARKSSRVI